MMNRIADFLRFSTAHSCRNTWVLRILSGCFYSENLGKRIQIVEFFEDAVQSTQITQMLQINTDFSICENLFNLCHLCAKKWGYDNLNGEALNGVKNTRFLIFDLRHFK